MVGSNLPPGTTPADIDAAFGEPETSIKHVEATVDVALSEDVDPSDLLDISGVPDFGVVHVEDIEESGGEFIKAVYVGVSFETQFEDSSDITREAAKRLSVESDDPRVTHVEHIDSEVV
jgi:hypothetical protein